MKHISLSKKLGGYNNFPEAPVDHELYGIKDKHWVRISDTFIEKFIKKDNYLYEIAYDDIDYQLARQHFENNEDYPINGACSVIKQGDFIGRNFDMLDDHRASVIVHTSAKNGRKQVTGTCCLGSLTAQKIDNKNYTLDELALLPFYMVDGINSSGLFCCSNVVPTWNNAETTPVLEQTDRISARMLVRYILDNFDTVDDVFNNLEGHIQIFMSEALHTSGYELHYFIADNESSMVLEFVDNRLKRINQNKATNFHLFEVTTNNDGSVYTNADVLDGHLPLDNRVEDYGAGLERFNILNSSTATSKAQMKSLMQSIFYTKTYTKLTNVWYSELVGNDGTEDITVNTPSTNTVLNRRFEYAREQYAIKSKDNPITWITTHSIIYDIQNKTLIVQSQEDNTEHSFTMNMVMVLQIKI